MFWLALVPPAMTRNAQPPHSQRLVVVEVSSLNRSISGSALLACRRSHDVPGLDMKSLKASAHLQRRHIFISSLQSTILHHRSLGQARRQRT